MAPPGDPHEDAAPAGGGARRIVSLRRRLAELGVASPEAEAWAMLEAATGRERLDLLTRAPADDPALDARLDVYLTRRAAGEPLQHVLGLAWFWGLPLRVGPAALIPRPETERLVELALGRLRDRREPHVLDVGAGSGAIALALAHERADARVWASDVDEEALRLARENGERLGLAVRFVRGDLLEAPELRPLLPRLDLLVTNPPYLPEADRARVAPEVRHDPGRALFAGPDGLEVWRRLEAQAHHALRPGARILAELDPRNVRVAAQEATRWPDRQVHSDLTGRERYLELVR